MVAVVNNGLNLAVLLCFLCLNQNGALVADIDCDDQQCCMTMTGRASCGSPRAARPFRQCLLSHLKNPPIFMKYTVRRSMLPLTLSACGYCESI